MDKQFAPQININFIFKTLRVKANMKQGQTYQSYDHIGGMLGLLHSIINQRRMHGNAHRPCHSKHLQHELSASVLYSTNRNQQPRTIITLAECGRHGLISEHRAKQTKKSNTQKSVSEQSEYNITVNSTINSLTAPHIKSQNITWTTLGCG